MDNELKVSYKRMPKNCRWAYIKWCSWQFLFRIVSAIHGIFLKAEIKISDKTDIAGTRLIFKLKEN